MHIEISGFQKPEIGVNMFPCPRLVSQHLQPPIYNNRNRYPSFSPSETRFPNTQYHNYLITGSFSNLESLQPLTRRCRNSELAKSKVPILYSLDYSTGKLIRLSYKAQTIRFVMPCLFQKSWENRGRPSALDHCHEFLQPLFRA